MFNLAKIFTAQEQSETLQKEQIASLLKTSPEALEAFEAAYQMQSLTEVSDNFFDINAKTAAALLPKSAPSLCPDEMVDRIVDELLGKTKVLVYKDNQLSTITFPTPDLPPVTPTDLAGIDKEDMPQLTGNYGMRDMPDSGAAVLFFYQRMLHAKNAKEKKFYYDHFRQGLDILDIDPILYEIIGTNRNSMGYWLPPLLESVMRQDFFRVPETSVLKVPIPLLQLTRFPYEGLHPSTIKILDRYCMRAFNLDVNMDYFIKTGTYSSKYDFRNAKVAGEKEVRELGEYLLFIHFQACQMASPFTTPIMYGVSTTNEWVVREFIPDRDKLPCIYNGMPLRTEYRVFVDFDAKSVLGMNPYWDPDVMKQRFGCGEDADSPNRLHDYVIYRTREDDMMDEYRRNEPLIREKIEEILGYVPLEGQWSIDIMQDGSDFYIIDMALAANSALNECVPAGLLKPLEENWLPKIPESK